MLISLEQKVADLTVLELKDIIKKSIDEILVKHSYLDIRTIPQCFYYEDFEPDSWAKQIWSMQDD